MAVEWLLSGSCLPLALFTPHVRSVLALLHPNEPRRRPLPENLCDFQLGIQLVFNWYATGMQLVFNWQLTADGDSYAKTKGILFAPLHSKSLSISLSRSA